MKKVWKRVKVQDVPPGQTYYYQKCATDAGFVRLADDYRNEVLVKAFGGVLDRYVVVVGKKGTLACDNRETLVWIETDASPEFVVRIGDRWYWGKIGAPTGTVESADKFPTNGDAQKAIERLPEYVDRSITYVEQIN